MTARDPAARRRRGSVALVAMAVVLLAGVDVGVGLLAHLRHRRVVTVADFATLRGINVYTLENSRQLPDSEVRGEPASSYEYLAGRGMQIIRLAVPWQRLQPVAADGDVEAALARPLDRSYLAAVEAETRKIEAAGMFPVLDLHNGCGFPAGPGIKPANQVYCGHALSTAQAVGIWTLLSDAFHDDDRIAAYDLFNEPTVGQVEPDDYRRVTQAVVTALRARGDHHTVWVEAMKGSSIDDLAPGGPWIHDPDGRTAYSAHFYPGYREDQDDAFGPADSHQGFLDAIDAFGRWCSAGRVHCSIGELGWPGDQTDPRPAAADQARWNALGDRAYALADRYGMDVTYFGAASNTDSPLWAYGRSPGDSTGDGSDRPATGIRAAFAQAAVIEAHPSRRRPGRVAASSAPFQSGCTSVSNTGSAPRLT